MTEPQFGCLGVDQFMELMRAAAAVRPDAAEPLKPSAWAEKMLNFTPTAKQAEILDIGAKST